MPEDLANELLDPLMLTDASKSGAIAQRIETAYKEATKAKINSINLNTRQKIFDVIGAVILAYSVIAKEEEIIIQIASDALQINVTKDEISKIINGYSKKITDLESLSIADRELIYTCSVWVALADGFFDESEKQVIDEIRTQLSLNTARSQEIYEKVVAIREERAEYIPKSEELPWWDEFERILVRSTEI